MENLAFWGRLALNCAGFGLKPLKPVGNRDSTLPGTLDVARVSADLADAATHTSRLRGENQKERES